MTLPLLPLLPLPKLPALLPITPAPPLPKLTGETAALPFEPEVSDWFAMDQNPWEPGAYQLGDSDVRYVNGAPVVYFVPRPGLYTFTGTFWILNDDDSRTPAGWRGLAAPF